MIMYKRTFINRYGIEYSFGISTFRDKLNGLDDYEVALECHNVTIMKNAKGERIIIHKVKR